MTAKTTRLDHEYQAVERMASAAADLCIKMDAIAAERPSKSWNDARIAVGRVVLALCPRISARAKALAEQLEKEKDGK